MTFNLDLTIFALFLLLNLGVGLWYGRGVRTLRDYAVADRRFPTWVIVLTIVATVTTGSKFEVVGLINKSGLLYIIALIRQLGQLGLLGLLFIRAGEFLGQLSLAEAMGSVYGPSVRFLAAGVGLMVNIGIVAIQFQASAVALKHLLGLSSAWAALLAAGIVIGYSSMGGIRSVTFTDLFQFMILALFFPLLVFLIWRQTPPTIPFAEFTTRYPLFSLSGFFQQKKAGFILLAVVFKPSNLVFSSAIFQRAQMCQSPQQARRAFFYAALLAAVLTFFWVLIAILLRMGNPGLVLTSQQAVLDHLFTAYTFPGLLGFGTAGLMAMVLSTADSFLNASALLFTNDLLVPLGLPKRHHLLAARWSGVGLGLVAWALAVSGYNVLDIMALPNQFYGPVLLVPFLLMLLGFRSTPRLFWASSGAGLLASLSFNFWIPEELQKIGIRSAVVGMAANLLTLLLLHYLLGEPGGWGGTKDKEPLRQDAVLRKRFWKRLRARLYRFHPQLLFGEQQAQELIPYFCIGLYGLLSYTGLLFALGAPLPACHFSSFIALIAPALLSSGLLMTSPAWVTFWDSRRTVRYLLPLLAGHLLFGVVAPLWVLQGAQPALWVFFFFSVFVGVTYFSLDFLLAVGGGYIFLTGLVAYRWLWPLQSAVPVVWSGIVMLPSALAALGLLLLSSRRSFLLKRQSTHSNRWKTYFRHNYYQLFEEQEAFCLSFREDCESGVVMVEEIGQQLRKASPEEIASGAFKKQFEALDFYVNNSVTYIDKKVKEVHRKIAMAYQALPLVEFLEALEEGLELWPELPQVVIDCQAQVDKLTCDGQRIQELLIQVVQQLPTQSDQIITLTVKQTQIAYPTPSGRQVPALAFIFRQGVVPPEGEQVADSYRHEERLVDQKQDFITSTVERHYGCLAPDPSGKRLVLALPVNIKAIRPKIAEEIADHPLSPEQELFAAQVEGDFWKAVAAKKGWEIKPILAAAQLMKKAHGHVKRKSGVPFYTHPFIVATHLLTWAQEEAPVIAALLHDVVEDTAVFLEEIAAKFGKQVHDIVRDVTNMRFRHKKYNLASKSEQALYLQRCSNRSSQLVKLCDRLHNMETLAAMSPQKQVTKAQETVDDFIPLARKIGYAQLAKRLEALCQPYLLEEKQKRS